MAKKKSEFVSNTKAFDNYAKGWKLMLANFWPLLAVIVIVTIIEMVGTTGRAHRAGGFVFSVLWSALLAGPIRAGAAGVLVKAARKKPFKISDIFDVFKIYGSAVGASVISFFLIAVGFVLLIVPGIIALVRLVFVPYLIIDKKMKPWDSIKTSWEMSRGYSWTILGMIILAVLISFVGMIILFVGIFLALLWISCSFTVLYNSISKKTYK